MDQNAAIIGTVTLYSREIFFWYLPIFYITK